MRRQWVAAGTVMVALPAAVFAASVGASASSARHARTGVGQQALVVHAGGGSSGSGSTGGTGGGGSGPSLSGFKLILPVNASGGLSGDAAELDPARLDSPWLTRDSNGALHFYAPAKGATTPHSLHARTELESLGSFTLGKTSASVSETVQVTQVPKQTPNIIVSQIHGAGSIDSEAYVMLHYDGGLIYVFVEGGNGDIDLIKGVPLGATVHLGGLATSGTMSSDTPGHTRVCPGAPVITCCYSRIVFA